MEVVLVDSTDTQMVTDHSAAPVGSLPTPAVAIVLAVVASAAALAACLVAVGRDGPTAVVQLRIALPTTMTVLFSVSALFEARKPGWRFWGQLVVAELGALTVWVTVLGS